MGFVAKVRGRESGDDQLELMPLNEVVHERSTTTSLSTLEEFSSSDGPTAVVPGVIRLRYIVHETIERSTVAHCNEGDTGHKGLMPGVTSERERSLFALQAGTRLPTYDCISSC